jgi:hypothetical protein
MIEEHGPYKWDFSNMAFEATWENENLINAWEVEIINGK